MTRIGIVGCGNISRFHHEGYSRAGAKIVHVCDIRREAAEAVGARYGARVSSEYQAIIADPEVDLISVLAPAHLHRDICLAAIAAGKGVVCEKTLSDNPSASAEIARAAVAKNAFFATAFMKRYIPAAVQAKELLGQMGRIFSIHARTWQPFASLWDPEVPEGLRAPSPILANYGGGVLVCGGSHILDLIHWFAGRPTQVCGHLWSREGLDFDIESNAMLWLEGGGIAHLETSWHPFSRVGYERNGWDERLEINTAAGRLDLFTTIWNEPEKNGALLRHEDAATGRVTEYRYPAVNPFDLEMAELLRRFEAGEPATPSAWDGYVVDELIAQITASSHVNEVRRVQWLDRNTD